MAEVRACMSCAFDWVALEGERIPCERFLDGECPPDEYDASEQGLLIEVFKDMLWSVTKDGGNKRARGEKPPWWKDQAHEAAIFSHLNKWRHGELADSDSGAHPLVHLAWRALAIAYQETYGHRDPVSWWKS